MAAVPPLSFAGIPRPAFGSARQHLDPPPGNTARVTTKADRRYTRAARLAADLIPTIPAPSEAVHALMPGAFDLCQVITATAPRLPNLRHIRIATLCYSKRNAAALAGLLESRKTADPLALTLLVSVFFVLNNKDGHEQTVTDLTAYPGVTVGAARSHCKVVCFDFGDRDGLVFEGSANLRGNRNTEQLCVVRDRGLHDFHAAWIDQTARAGGGK